MDIMLYGFGYVFFKKNIYDFGGVIDMLLQV